LILNFTKYNTNDGIKGLLTITDNTNNLEMYIDNNTFKVKTNSNTFNVGTVTLNSTDVYMLKIDFQTKQIQLVNNTNETPILTHTYNVILNHNIPLKVRIGDGVTVKSTTTT
jgi:DNA replicative helicase MCM subunit Mcm2 (Cdc46/Mcm family)